MDMMDPNAGRGSLAVLTLDRAERDAIRGFVEHYIDGDRLAHYVGTADSARARRWLAHLDTMLTLLDQLGWTVEDERTTFELRLEPPMLALLDVIAASATECLRDEQKARIGRLEPRPGPDDLTDSDLMVLHLVATARDATSGAER